MNLAVTFAVAMLLMATETLTGFDVAAPFGPLPEIFTEYCVLDCFETNPVKATPFTVRVNAQP